LTATAAGYLTADVASALSFDALVSFKQLLLRFFSPAPWTADDAAALHEVVAPHVDQGWWEHDLGTGISLLHGIRDDRYVLWVTGGSTPAPSIFDRVFAGPVVPEATPHPRKVKFAMGGAPAPGIWYRRDDPEISSDGRVKRLFAEPDVTDVMVAGDFVTIGIGARSSWERRLEPLLSLVADLFADPAAAQEVAPRTRDELLREAAASEHPETARPEELHLLDPDDPDDRGRLETAFDSPDARMRRVAVAVLLESGDPDVRAATAVRGYADPSPLVRRITVDAAADAADEAFRPLFEKALGDADAWIRWKAVRSLGDLGADPSREAIEAAVEDPEFRVRFEAARVLRALE
jgi:hypothetical protein